MILSFHPCFVADRQIILGSRCLDISDSRLIEEAKAIILPQSCSEELYLACKKSSAYIFPDYDTRFKYPGKTGQSILFEKTDTPHPKTCRWQSVDEFRKTFQDQNSLPHKTPFLLKTDKGHEAEGVYLIKDHKTLDSYLEKLKHAENSGTAGFISQELIPAEGNVLRIVTMGHSSITYWRRPSAPGQIITSASKNGIIDMDWRADLQEKGKIKVKDLTDKTGIDLAAIDCIFPIKEDNPQPMILEINYYFGRRGLGGSVNYYGLLFQAIQYWLAENDLDPKSISLI